MANNQEDMPVDGNEDAYWVCKLACHIFAQHSDKIQQAVYFNSVTFTTEIAFEHIK